MTRTPQELLEVWSTATADNPIIIVDSEHENFITAMRISQRNSDIEKGFIKCSGQILDKDTMLKDGLQSMADGKIYTNRHDYNEHLKRNGLVEVGDKGIPNKSELRGDFGCREELRAAINQHLN